MHLFSPDNPAVSPVFFDMERLSLVAENAAEKATVLKLFFHEANWHSRQMRYALQHPDVKLYKETAHSLMGAAANMGMHNLAHLCQQAIQQEHAMSKDRKEALDAICKEIQKLHDYLIQTQLLPAHV